MYLLRTLIFALLVGAQALAQQVSIEMPQSQGYVGVPMRLVVVFENMQTPANPTLPEIEGFTIRRMPGEQTSSRTSFINGKVTSSSTVAITFILTPIREGVFEIPPLLFEADGKNFQSTSRTVTVRQPPTGGALKIEIDGTDGNVYLGQPIDVTLRVFIEAFTDPTLGITLEAGDMISLLHSESTFGIFADAIQEGQVSVQRVQGTTDAGIPTTFYVLGVQATTWPETTGMFAMDPISILMNYPISLSREQGLGFFDRNTLKVSQSHLISASGQMPTIEVLPLPNNNKPAWFSGAIGTYDFRMVAEPTHVKVGEPITLTMRVTDRTSGPINLDFLSAPLLDRVSSLTDQFRVPDTPLGGTVDGRTKTFTQSIRPRNSSTSEIPPLPMTSYDPDSGTYKTVWTNPIPISVDAVATVSVDDLVGHAGLQEQRAEQSNLTEVVGGILANYAGNNLLASQAVSLSPLLSVLIASGPIMFTFALCVLVYRKRGVSSSMCKKDAVRHATLSIKQAASMQGEQQAQSISSALRMLQHTQDEYASEILTLLQRCDATQFGGVPDSSLAEDASTLVESLR